MATMNAQELLLGIKDILGVHKNLADRGIYITNETTGVAEEVAAVEVGYDNRNYRCLVIRTGAKRVFEGNDLMVEILTDLGWQFSAPDSTGYRAKTAHITYLQNHPTVSLSLEDYQKTLELLRDNGYVELMKLDEDCEEITLKVKAVDYFRSRNIFIDVEFETA